MLKAERVSVRREKDGPAAPENLSFEASPGRVVGVAGKNGSGKTSLALVLAGLLPRVVGGEWSGIIRFRDNFLSAAGWPAQVTAAYSCQDQTSGALLGILGDILQGLPNDLRDLAALLPLPAASTQVAHLSSGQKHILDWILCQARRPHVLIMDEGLSSLDSETATALIHGSRTLKGFDGQVSLLLDQDTRRLDGRVDDILQMPSPPALGSVARPLTAPEAWADLFTHIHEGPGNWVSHGEISAWWPNRSNSTRYKIPYFRFESGAVSQVRGRVGAGKSTLLKALSGLPGPSSNGRLRSLRDSWRPMYIGANDHFVTAHPSIRALLGASVGQSRENDAWEVLAPYLPDKTIDSDPGTLSFGQRHLLAIFVLLAQSGQAAVLDEPDKGLDERAQGLLIQLVSAFLAAGGAVALASHNAAFLDHCQAAVPLWQTFDIEVAQ